MSWCPYFKYVLSVLQHGCRRTIWFNQLMRAYQAGNSIMQHQHIRQAYSYITAERSIILDCSYSWVELSRTHPSLLFIVFLNVLAFPFPPQFIRWYHYYVCLLVLETTVQSVVKFEYIFFYRLISLPLNTIGNKMQQYFVNIQQTYLWE